MTRTGTVLGRILLAALVSTLVGCAKAAYVDGFAMGRVPEGARFVVKRHSGDNRDLAESVATALSTRGLRATVEGEDGDYLVTYTDKWYWDMRMYMVDMRIDVRDTQTNCLVGSARSFQTSIPALGKTPDSIIDRTIAIITGERSPPPPPERETQ